MIYTYVANSMYIYKHVTKIKFKNVWLHHIQLVLNNHIAKQLLGVDLGLAEREFKPSYCSVSLKQGF